MSYLHHRAPRKYTVEVSAATTWASLERFLNDWLAPLAAWQPSDITTQIIEDMVIFGLLVNSKKAKCTNSNVFVAFCPISVGFLQSPSTCLADLKGLDESKNVHNYKQKRSCLIEGSVASQPACRAT